LARAWRLLQHFFNSYESITDCNTIRKTFGLDTMRFSLMTTDRRVTTTAAKMLTDQRMPPYQKTPNHVKHFFELKNAESIICYNDYKNCSGGTL